jgi:hypothetical protein
MAIIEGATSGNLAEVDTLLQQKVVPGFPAVLAAGGHYTVAGQTSAIVAAALAANTTLMAMRLNPASSRKAYVDKVRVCFSVATPGAAGGVAGTLGLQRFNTATPSGGTSRTANRQQESAGTATDMVYIGDSNAALTVTSVVFGAVVGVSLVPLVWQTTSGAVMAGFEWIYEPPRPTVLIPGDGLCLRTQVAMAATQTWLYSYTIHWEEHV